MDQGQGILAEELTAPTRDPGSFRDPSGFVCHLKGSVFRAVDAECAARFRDLECSGLLERLQRSGGLIRTSRVDRDEPIHRILREHLPRANEYLRHEKVPTISYPYEWSASMLVDAATRCLDLQLTLMASGYSLKDATAYNLQFVKAQPVFIDTPSIETVQRRDIWMALDQFYRMFVYPLLLHSHRRGDIKGYFLANLDGVSLKDVYTRFGLFGAIRPSLWLDLLLPRQLQRLARGDGQTLRTETTKTRGNAQGLEWNLRRLRRKLIKLRPKDTASSAWTSYADDNTYTPDETQRKEAFIGAFLDEHRPRRVLDIGCNTGRFTELAARRGLGVVSIDSDTTCIDRLYKKANAEGWDVTPLVVDIANPSPGTGFRNIERAPLTQRTSSDCVFALALLHHLLITSRLPLDSIVDLMADLTSSRLVVEFIAPQDEMFQSLLAAREDIYGHLTLDHYFEAFGKRFDLIERAPITEHRVLASFGKSR